MVNETDQASRSPDNSIGRSETMKMSGVGSYTVDGEVGIITIDSPPVNALGIKVRVAIAEGLLKFLADDAVKAIVLICAGRTFFAGADINELNAADTKVLMTDDLGKAWDDAESGTKPVIAAIHGTALGGGYETSLKCHYRIAVPSANVGLPEVKLGLLPGGLGTQRLPRIVGAQKALEIMVSGDPVPAPKALELGMIDALAEEGRLLEDAVAFARRILAEGRPLTSVRDRQDMVDPDKGNARLFADFRKANAKLLKGFKAPEAIIKCVEAAVELPYVQGEKREAELFRELLTSPESAAQRYFFFAERIAAKIPDVPPTTPTRPVNTVGIIGAGTMGTGIAIAFLDAGIAVTLVEMNQAALDRGLAAIRKNYDGAVQKGRLSEDQAAKRLALVSPAIELSALSSVDLIIEAVFEDLQVKKDLLAKLDGIAKADAILATNTSYLDVDQIAAATSRPESVVGLHFFSPANIMRLLEVVRGAKTTPEVIATGMKLAKNLGKVAVLSRVCHGFIANRVMSKRGAQADAIVLEGVSPEDVDKAVQDFGFAIGPFRMRDMAGMDIGAPDPSLLTVRGEMIKLGRLGMKTNAGFYDYEGRNATFSPVAAEVIARVAKGLGVENRGPQSAEDIIARLLYPVVNEGAKVLEEGIALRASDIDVACILGFNWPVYTGGPMFWADQVGLDKIVAKLEELEQIHGADFRPSGLLRKLAASGGKFTG